MIKTDSRLRIRRLTAWILSVIIAAGVFVWPVPAAGEEEWLVGSPYKRVIFIGVDGAGTYFREMDTPNFDKIFAEGKITWEAKAPVPTNSAPGWCSMFYGVSFAVHGVDNPKAETTPFENDTLKSVFRQVLEQYPGERVGVFASWHAIPYGMIDRKAGPGSGDESWKKQLKKDPDAYDSGWPGLTVFPMGTRDPGPDEVLKEAQAWLKTGEDFRLLFFYLDLPDLAGHKNGFSTPPYLNAIKKTDKYLGQLWNTLEKKGLTEDALVILATDHGGTLEGTHGGDSDEETTCMFAVRGPGITPGTPIGPTVIMDAAAVIRYALGLPTPEYNEALIPEGIFDDLPEGEAEG